MVKCRRLFLHDFQAFHRVHQLNQSIYLSNHRPTMSLTEDWLQDVAESCKIEAVAPSVTRIILPVVEIQIKRIIQQAAKIQKRGKGRNLTVEDINLALSLNGLEEIYGLNPPSDSVVTSSTSNNVGIINLLEFAKQPIPRCPLIPELSLHWLAVEGCQPLIPENPLFVADKSKADSTNVGGAGSLAASIDTGRPWSLPKEMQHFFSRTTVLILAGDHTTLPTVLLALQKDVGIQDLVPYYSRFIYQQIKANANTKSLSMLKILVSAATALISNEALHVEFHIQQMLPAIFTCIVAARICTSPSDNHWVVRDMAAELVAQCCRKYCDLCPDLHARVCRTYLDTLTAALSTALIPPIGNDTTGGSTQAAMGSASSSGHGSTSTSSTPTPSQRIASLSTLYGGLIGLSSLGQAVIKSLILPRVYAVNEALEYILSELNNKFRIQQQSSSSIEIHRDAMDAVERCRSALLHALGSYMVERSRFGGLNIWNATYFSAERSSIKSIDKTSTTTAELPPPPSAKAAKNNQV
jgi:transcription initiation factor TFIID subunit 6